MVATLAQAQSDLDQYKQRLLGCVQRAIREFMADHSKVIYKLETRTQANILRDYIVANIKAEFPRDEPGVSYSSRNGLFLLNLQNRYFLRFKKLDRRLRSRNSPTQLSLDYLLQRPLELFPTLEPATHLNVGYQPGMTLSSSSVWVTCPDGGVLDWKWGISEPQEPVQLPVRRTASDTTPGRPAKPRVRPKVEPSKKADDATE